MRNYDHRVHAGNAGDVWKHFLLLEVADYLLIPDSSLVYAETHVGRPEYALSAPGDWEGGIGKCWPILSSLKNFCYFNILAEFNPNRLKCYPGSACLVLQAARTRYSILHAEVWDIDSEVGKAWQGYSRVSFHQGDGFLGLTSLLERSPPGLLLIDPPYLDPSEMTLAVKLLCRAKERGWTVLWWYMMGSETALQRDLLTNSQKDFEKYSLMFAEAGFDGGRWGGAVVALACPDNELKKRLRIRVREFAKVMSDAESF